MRLADGGIVRLLLFQYRLRRAGQVRWISFSMLPSCADGGHCASSGLATCIWAAGRLPRRFTDVL